jgi:hypothetical protein
VKAACSTITSTVIGSAIMRSVAPCNGLVIRGDQVANDSLSLTVNPA